MSFKIPLKAMSVNTLYTGQRYKTPAYRKYMRDLQLLLKPMEIPEGKLRLKIVFGVSNVRSDLDNLLKGTIDGLMGTYNFDDSRIYSLWARKDIVPRGQEYIEIELDKAR